MVSDRDAARRDALHSAPPKPEAAESPAPALHLRKRRKAFFRMPFPVAALASRLANAPDAREELNRTSMFLTGALQFLALTCIADAVGRAEVPQRKRLNWLKLASHAPSAGAWWVIVEESVSAVVAAGLAPFLKELPVLIEGDFRSAANRLTKLRNFEAHELPGVDLSLAREKLNGHAADFIRFFDGLSFLPSYALGFVSYFKRSGRRHMADWHPAIGLEERGAPRSITVTRDWTHQSVYLCDSSNGSAVRLTPFVHFVPAEDINTTHLMMLSGKSERAGDPASAVRFSHQHVNLTAALEMKRPGSEDVPIRDYPSFLADFENGIEEARIDGFVAPEHREDLFADVSMPVVGTRYELVGRLGGGGNGSVWLAEESATTRQVALKVLHQSQGSDASHLTRFRKEAALLRRIDHPRIVKLLDSQSGGTETPLLVLEYLAGDNLEETVRKRSESLAPADLDEALTWVLQACEAVGAVHAQGVIHRDIKPANFVVTNGGLKLIDFGIALDPQSHNTRQTRTGQWVGTTYYMAPELFDGDEATRASDIFALGKLLQFVLLGDARKANAIEQLRRTTVPTQVVSIVARATAREPSHRFQSVEELRVEVASSLRSRGGGIILGVDDALPASAAGERPDGLADLAGLFARELHALSTPLAQAIERFGQHAQLVDANLPERCEHTCASVVRFLSVCMSAHVLEDDHQLVAHWLSTLKVGGAGIASDVRFLAAARRSDGRARQLEPLVGFGQMLSEWFENRAGCSPELSMRRLGFRLAEVVRWAAPSLRLVRRLGSTPNSLLSAQSRVVPLCGISPSWWGADTAAMSDVGYFVTLVGGESMPAFGMLEQRDPGLSPLLPWRTRSQQVEFASPLDLTSTKQVPLAAVIASLTRR